MKAKLTSILNAAIENATKHPHTTITGIVAIVVALHPDIKAQAGAIGGALVLIFGAQDGGSK